MSTLSESSQDSLGWVYPAPVVEFVSVPVADQRGTTQLVVGQAYIDVAFHSTQTNANWILVACEIVNTTDATPLNISTGVITVRNLTGFRIQLEGIPDSGNYYLHWAINGVVIPPVPADTYTLMGATSGRIGAAATFTVALPMDTTLEEPVTITPSDGGGGGTFAPTSVELSEDEPEASFTYTPGLYGTKTISTTNDGALTDPADLAFISTAATYTLSGPSSGVVSVASTNFTVALPASGVVIGTVTVTPSDGGGGGTFTPTTVALTTAAPSVTFTYTPASGGAKTISVTNDGGLTNPGNLTYTVTVPATPHLLNTLISYWKLDEAVGAGDRMDSHGTNHLTQPIGNVNMATALLGNGAYANGNAGQTYLNCADNATLRVTGDFTFSVWVRTDDALFHVVLGKSANDGSAHEYLLYNSATGMAFQAGAAPAVNTGVALGGFGWHHVVCWYDSSDQKCRIRMDDTTTYTAATGGALATPTTYVFGMVAMSGGQGPWNGLIDEVGFWKRLLTAQEITALYNSGAPLPYSSFTA